MITPVSSRKKPRCRACRMPMAGHQRVSGKLVCSTSMQAANDSDDDNKEEDVEEPLSPPQSPSPQPRKSTPRNPTRDDQPQACDEIKQEPTLFEDGELWQHWRNPNANFRSPYRPPARNESFQSTLLCDHEGIPIPEDEEAEAHGSTTTTQQSETLADVLAHAKPIATIYGFRKDDLQGIRRYATSIGLHIGTFLNPRFKRHPRSSTTSTLADTEERDYWMVMGQNKDDVQYLLDMHQRKMPGLMGSTADLVEWDKASKANNWPPFWRWLFNFINLMVAATIGAFLAAAIVLNKLAGL